jgi:hypothetical protein
MSKGFAMISYFKKDDAAKAIYTLNGLRSSQSLRGVVEGLSA